MELYHYGVKGMKWGVRRYQNKDGSFTAAGKHRNAARKNIGRNLQRYTSPGVQSAKNFTKRFANRLLSQLIPGYGLVVMATSLSAYSKYALDGKDYVKKEGEYEKLSELKRKTTATSINDDLKACNPRLGNQKGKVNNCLYCAATMEMRQRGYDVVARSKGYGDTANLYSKWFEGAKIEQVPTTRNPGESRKQYANRAYDNLCKTLEKQGDGARGYVGVHFEKTASGHAMYYKVENGAVTFYDGQNKSSGVGTDKTFALADPSAHHYARLDNCKVNESVTEACISNKKG